MVSVKRKVHSWKLKGTFGVKHLLAEPKIYCECAFLKQRVLLQGQCITEILITTFPYVLRALLTYVASAVFELIAKEPVAYVFWSPALDVYSEKLFGVDTT